MKGDGDSMKKEYDFSKSKRNPYFKKLEQEQSLHHQWVLEQIAQAQKEAKDPNTKFLTVEEVFSKFRKKHNYEM